MGGQLGLGHVGDEAGQVDEAAYAARGHCVCHHLGGEPVTVAEVGAVEGVHEVDHGVDVADRLGHDLGVGHVAADRADALVPAEPVRVGHRRRRGDDVVPALEQVRDEAGADVAGRAEDEDPHASPRCLSRLREKTAPMCLTTPAITRSTAIRASPGSGSVAAISRSMLTSVPPSPWSARS